MKISVIIPIFNVEKYLSKCIESVLSQTYKNLEIILIDDCGNDNSIKIAQKYIQQDSRIKIIHHSSNKGLAPARNTGLENSSGDYIFFLDSDDYIDKNTLEKLYIKAKETDADFVIGESTAFPETDDEETKKRALKLNEYLKSPTQAIIQVTKENFAETILKIPVVSWGKLFKAEFIKKNKLLFINENVIHEDDGFFLKFMSCLPKIAFSHEQTVMYRIRPLSITAIQDKKKKKQNFELSLKDALNYISPRSPYLAKIIRYHTHYSDSIKSKFSFLFKKIHLKNYLKIKIFGLTVFKIKITEIKKSIYLLGVCIYKREIKNA